MNKYEIAQRDAADARRNEPYLEHVRGHVCPECKSELALSWTRYGVYEVNCPECDWGEEVS